MKLWIDDVRPAPEGYVWCKSTLILLLLCFLCLSFISCTKQPETIVEYVEVPIKETVCCGISGIEYAPLNQQYAAIICSNCGRQLGELPIAEREVIKEVPVIVEKEVVKEVQVPVEVIVEKEVVVEKIVEIEKEVFTMPFYNFASWEEILTWEAGDKIEHLTVVNGYLVSGYEIITDYDKSGTLWQYVQYDFIYPVKLYYGCKESLSFERLGSYAVADLSGTIYSIRWETDVYGNKSCIVDFGWDHTFIELSAIQWE